MGLFSRTTAAATAEIQHWYEDPRVAEFTRDRDQRRAAVDDARADLEKARQRRRLADQELDAVLFKIAQRRATVEDEKKARIELAAADRAVADADAELVRQERVLGQVEKLFAEQTREVRVEFAEATDVEYCARVVNLTKAIVAAQTAQAELAAMAEHITRDFGERVCGYLTLPDFPGPTGKLGLVDTWAPHLGPELVPGLGTSKRDQSLAGFFLQRCREFGIAVDLE